MEDGSDVGKENEQKNNAKDGNEEKQPAAKRPRKAGKANPAKRPTALEKAAEGVPKLSFGSKPAQ